MSFNIIPTFKLLILAFLYLSILSGSSSNANNEISNPINLSTCYFIQKITNNDGINDYYFMFVTNRERALPYFTYEAVVILKAKIYENTNSESKPKFTTMEKAIIDNKNEGTPNRLINFILTYQHTGQQLQVSKAIILHSKHGLSENRTNLDVLFKITGKEKENKSNDNDDLYRFILKEKTGPDNTEVRLLQFKKEIKQISVLHQIKTDDKIVCGFNTFLQQFGKEVFKNIINDLFEEIDFKKINELYLQNFSKAEDMIKGIRFYKKIVNEQKQSLFKKDSEIDVKFVFKDDYQKKKEFVNKENEKIYIVTDKEYKKSTISSKDKKDKKDKKDNKGNKVKHKDEKDTMENILIVTGIIVGSLLSVILVVILGVKIRKCEVKEEPGNDNKLFT